jgi:hypothetical protein
MRQEGGRREIREESHWPISPPVWKWGRKMAEKAPYLGYRKYTRMNECFDGKGEE